MERIAGIFLLSWGCKRVGIAIAAGAFSALAMPPFDAFPVLFVTMPILVWLLDATATDPARGGISRAWNFFRTGWWFGFGYFLAGLWWVGNALLVDGDQFAWLMPVAVLALPALLALFWGLGTAMASLAWRDDWRRIAALAAGLGAAESLRGTVATGFPWNSIGQAAMTFPLTMQSASIMGLYGVTLLSIPVFAAGAMAGSASERGARNFFVFCLALTIAHVGFGAWRLSTPLEQTAHTAQLRIVQPAIDQAEKWSPEAADRNFRMLLDLSTSRSRQGEEGLSHVDLLVWPETAFPFILTERRDALAALSAMIPQGTLLAAGAVRLEPPAPGQTRELAFNSVYLIDDQGEIVGAADKTHLVPFGEYLPFQAQAEALGFQQLTKLRGGFEPGSSRRSLSAGKAGSFLPLICYEIIFPGQTGVESGTTSWILNVTNDAWFGMTPGPYQHWRQAIIRGVEAGLPVVRAANNGISSVSDAYGRVIARTSLGERAVMDVPLPAPAGTTWYSMFGNQPFFGMLALFVLLAAQGRRAA